MTPFRIRLTQGRIMKIPAMLLAALGVVAAAPQAYAQAQDYPNRTIRGITTTSAGGISDIFLRALGDELSKRWGQTFVVENRPGGAQNVGTRACSDAPPDGYTICIVNADPLVYNQFRIKNMPFKPETVLLPVTGLYHLIQNLAVNSELGVKNVDELVALSKAKPKTLSYLTAATPMQIYMDWMVKEKGANWVRVPFRGGGQALNAVLQGSTPIALIGEANMLASMRAGTVTALAMINNIKSRFYPDVPTLEETGYKGPPSRSWYGIFVPPGTPRPIIDKLHKEIHDIVNQPEFMQRHIVDRSLTPFLNTPEEFADIIVKDRVAAEKMMKDAGIEPQ
jgi:tripartite-type tricarboxylate transporter receptor subunit TctC